MPDIGYLNGQFAHLHEIAISPDDRGFLFGDGIYEVVRAYRGVPVFWVEHFIRLSRSAKEIRLSVSLTKEQFHDLLLSGISQSQFQEVKVYLQMTRGVAPRDHAFPGIEHPTLFASFREMTALPQDCFDKGVAAITVPDIRWGRCDIKSLNLLPNVLAKQQAQDANAFEAIFIKNGEVKEGSTSNVFLAKNGELHTPERNQDVLSGVTQQQVMDLAKEGVADVHCHPLTEHDLMRADEAFLVGTTIEVLPLVRVNGENIGNGKPGSMTRDIQRQFSALVSRIAVPPH